MASNPFFHKVCRAINERGGEDWLFAQIADNRSLKSISEELGCSRDLLYKWRKQQPYRDERMRRWNEARKASAESKLEDGEQVLVDLAECGEVPLAAEVSLASTRAKYAMDMAKLADPDLQPKQAGVEVNVNLGELHLDALRTLGGGEEVKQLSVIEETVDE